MYVNTLLHCHFCIQIITNNFLQSKVSHPIPGINAHLLYPIVCPWKYSIRHTLLYCPVCIVYCWLFPWQPTLCSILPLFLYWGDGGSTGRGCNKYGETLFSDFVYFYCDIFSFCAADPQFCMSKSGKLGRIMNNAMILQLGTIN